MNRLTIILILCAFLSGITELRSQALFQPDNLDFEKGVPGYIPPYWKTARSLLEAGSKVETTEISPYEGDFCVLLTHVDPSTDMKKIDESALPIYLILDAAPYRGKTVKLSAHAKIQTGSHLSSGELWAIGRTTKEDFTFTKYQSENPIITDHWLPYSITFDVPDETNELRIGILIKGTGSLRADDFKLEIIQPDSAVNEPARKLNNRELNNLKILAYLEGYLRSFNPAIDYSINKNDNSALYAISNAEKMKTDKELENFLNKYAKMLSPVSLINANANADINYNKPDDAIQYLAYFKKHTGGPVDISNELFGSGTVNIFASHREREASAVQMIDVVKHQGEEIKISASIKVIQESPGANAQIWAKADVIASDEYEFATSAENPAMSSEWRRYELTMKLPQKVHTIKLAMVFLGEGKAYFDDIKIEKANGEKLDVFIDNQGFEYQDSLDLPVSWSIDPNVLSAGYTISLTKSESSKGMSSLMMASDSKNRLNYPLIGKYYSYKISDKLFLHHPLVYYANNSGVLPLPDKNELFAEGKPAGYNPNINDRHSRIMGVMKLWNLIKHFSKINIDEAVLDSVLTHGLDKAATDSSHDEYISTLRSMLLTTQDSRAIAWASDIQIDYTFPVMLRHYNGTVIASTIVDTNLAITPGDELLSIDGIKISDMINAQADYIAGNNHTYRLTKALAEIRSGTKDSEHEFEFQNPDRGNYKLKIKRSTLFQNVYDPRPYALVELDTGYVYVNLTELDDTKLRDYIEAIAARKAVIFDLRGQTGVSEHLLSFLTQDNLQNARWEVPVITHPDRELLSYKTFGGTILEPQKQLSELDCIFLMDEKTSGYSEALISIIKHHKLGKVMGTESCGNASESYAVRLFGTYAVSLTGLDVYSPDGTKLFNNPISPDITLPYEFNSESDQPDNLIQKALLLLKK